MTKKERFLLKKGISKRKKRKEEDAKEKEKKSEAEKNIMKYVLPLVKV